MAFKEDVEKILYEYDFQQDENRKSWYNSLSRKVFTNKALNKYPVQWVFERIHEPNETGRWQLYDSEGTVNVISEESWMNCKKIEVSEQEIRC